MIVTVDKKRSSEVNELKRTQIMVQVMQHYDHDKKRVKNGGYAIIQQALGVSEKQIRTTIEKQKESGDLSTKRIGNCGVSNLQMTPERLEQLHELDHAFKCELTFERLTAEFNEKYQTSLHRSTIRSAVRNLLKSSQLVSQLQNILI